MIQTRRKSDLAADRSRNVRTNGELAVESAHPNTNGSNPE